MRVIRMFLWGLVATMTLQGYLHADEYGTAASFIGGMTLTLAIWKESLWDQMRGLLPGRAVINTAGIPRAFVIAALQESARHPGLHTLPPLRRALADHRRAWDAFRDVEVQWMLQHADLIGALRSEGRHVWEPWQTIHETLTADLTAAKEQWCVSVACLTTRREKIARLAASDTIAVAAANAWERLLSMDSMLHVLTWWNATVSPDKNLTAQVSTYHRHLTALHNITQPRDRRVSSLTYDANQIATWTADVSGWHRPILRSLLLRDLWTACLEHIRLRESRVQELMVMAGVQDLYNTHERILAAALRTVGAKADAAKLVQGWFDEAAAHAWWLTEEIPAIVRRCMGQDTGECRRIGQTEIAALTAQFDERTQIVGDWNRRLFIGLWNALPAVGLLFILEVIVMLLPRRRIYTMVAVDPTGAPMLQNGKTIPLAINN
jgi:hypothetical protein